MKDSFPEAALTRAIQALKTISENDIRQLTLTDSAIMLGALPRVAKLASVRQRLAERLRKHLNTSWIDSGAMDTVFCVLAALWNYDPKFVSGEQLACAIQRLITSESAAGGPYYSDNVVAIIPNIHIAIFMRAAAEPLPEVDAFLGRVIAAERFEETELTRSGLLYLLAKAGLGQKLIKHAAFHRQTPQNIAVALTILKDELPIREISRLFATLCQGQQPSGFWDGEPLVKTESGSHLVTTALISAVLVHVRSGYAKTSGLQLQQEHDAVHQAAKQLFNACTEPLRSSSMSMVDRVCAADTNFEITLLPQLFARALQPPPLLGDQAYTSLSLANLCCWIAYTIYDDFLDEEGTPANLPVANVAMRGSLDCFEQAFTGQSTALRYVAKVFTEMDEANAWEVNHCRFVISSQKVVIRELPKFGHCGMLAARAFAHALAPMLIVMHGVETSTNTKIQHVESAFRHYLIARQLNDDMHDWLKDMQSGQASYVVTAILRDMRITPGGYTATTLLPAMQRCFRQTTMLKVCQQILRHIGRSQRAFERSQLLRPKNAIYQLLDTLELSVHYSLDIYAKSHALTMVHTGLDQDS